MNKNRNSLFILLDRRGKLVNIPFESRFDLTSISMKHLMESNQHGSFSSNTAGFIISYSFHINLNKMICVLFIYNFQVYTFSIFHSFSKIDTFYNVSHEGGGYRLLRPRFVANDV